MEEVQQDCNCTTQMAMLMGGIVLLLAVKKYFGGGVCRASRNMQGKVVVVTGGNSGIGK